MAGYKRKWKNDRYPSTSKPSYKRRKVAVATRKRNYATKGGVFKAEKGRTFKRKFVCTNKILSGSTVAATTGKLGAESVSLSLVPEQANYTKVFDQYRITHVKWTFTNVGSNSSVATTKTPFIYYAADFDDQNRPATKGAILNMDNVKKDSLTPGKMVHVNVKPRLAQALYNNGLTTGYGLGPAAAWVDCASIQIPHYGMKYCIDNMLTDAYTIDLETTIWVEFRGNHE